MRSLLLRLYGVFTTAVQPLVRRKLRRRAEAEPGYGVAVEERFGRYDASITGQAQCWVHAVSLGDEDGGRTRFAERHGMHPALGFAGDGCVVVAEAFFDGHGIARLGLRAAPQLAAHQRLHDGGEGAVQAQQQRTHRCQ